MEEQPKSKELGEVQSITIDITDPVQLKFENLNYRNLTLLTGLNGTGKSFVMKMTWVMATFINHVLTAVVHKLPYNQNPGMQFLLDKTFTHNDLTGSVTMGYMFGNFITIELDQGKVTKLVLSLEENMVPSGQPIYMSSGTRLFSGVISYMRLRNSLGIAPGMLTNDSELTKLCDSYILPDVLFIEELLLNITTKTTPDIIKGFNESIKKFDEKFQITDIKADYAKAEILISDDKRTDYSITQLGSGHQALGTILLFMEYKK